MRQFSVVGDTPIEGPFSAPPELLAAWRSTDGFPREVEEAFALSGRDELADITPTAAYLDVEIGDAEFDFEPIPLLVIAEAQGVPYTICVFPEMGDGFGEMASAWVAEGPRDRTAKFAALQGLLGIEERQLALDLAIGFMRSMALTILAAREVGAQRTVLLIHDFAPDSGWFDEYELIGQTMGTDPPRDRVIRIGGRAGVELYSGWVTAPVSRLDPAR